MWIHVLEMLYRSTLSRFIHPNIFTLELHYTVRGKSRFYYSDGADVTVVAGIHYVCHSNILRHLDYGVGMFNSLEAADQGQKVRLLDARHYKLVIDSDHVASTGRTLSSICWCGIAS